MARCDTVLCDISMTRSVLFATPSKMRYLDINQSMLCGGISCDCTGPWNQTREVWAVTCGYGRTSTDIQRLRFVSQSNKVTALSICLSQLPSGVEMQSASRSRGSPHHSTLNTVTLSKFCFTVLITPSQTNTSIDQANSSP